MAKWALALLAIPLCAQTQADWKSVLERLDRLERENHELKEQVKSLTERVGGTLPEAPAPPEAVAAKPEASLEERMAIQEQRVDEQAQTKVEGSQRFPIRLTGMVLFNSFYSTRTASGQDMPLTASVQPGSHAVGATFRQTILGLEYQGPATLWGGKVKSSLFLDFFDGTAEGTYAPARIRTANIELEWKTRSVAFAVEKPIFNPREPTSLSQVAISPLTAAGNLWRWQPQIRLQQRFHLAERTEFRAQLGVLQTSEDVGYAPAFTPASLERRRPGWEGRFELAHNLDSDRRIEIASGFHYSRTHVVGVTVPSQLVSLDWFANPWWSKLEFTGAFFHGQNVAHFGVLRQGFQIYDNDAAPVHATGGWGQLAFRPLPRLTFHVMAGVHDDQDSDLRYYPRIGQNRIGAANVMYRLAPNIIWSLEAMRIQTNYLGSGWRLLNRYDMAVAYQF